MKSDFKEALLPGVVHALPDDVCRALKQSLICVEQWQSLTPLGRNEWICWVEDAKKSVTREKRIARLLSDLAAGKRRPCCWPGCSHRPKNK
ncbi:YdeI/OmpD-associated family protein [Gilvimarinus agarilyticus]|uniref:YdeI/OmpD-associated family protein n=1 Tax=Gilvimarinus sp. 2_MG-2023 TaxID=3062666 RepID=UPI001C08051C|nr:YdeI/OmpD-associated family protein [Gilvimarinus sp. 2_MG-2023]MBU2886322.1 YdeI/OmpD-associated family protein [Gilvimarinus agarilyticus]MDO6571008.1 YdeI/OmpD-associated family protein [Gilvimarinus sp. 2_MG-2023]